VDAHLPNTLEGGHGPMVQLPPWQLAFEEDQAGVREDVTCLKMEPPMLTCFSVLELGFSFFLSVSFSQPVRVLCFSLFENSISKT
jgi:hypothetical protein